MHIGRRKEHRPDGVAKNYFRIHQGFVAANPGLLRAVVEILAFPERRIFSWVLLCYGQMARTEPIPWYGMHNCSALRAARTGFKKLAIPVPVTEWNHRSGDYAMGAARKVTRSRSVTSWNASIARLRGGSCWKYWLSRCPVESKLILGRVCRNEV